MGAAPAIVFGIVATGLEIALVALHFPLPILLIVGLVSFATDLLFVSFSPFAIAASAATYLAAVAVGLVSFSVIGFALSTV